MTAPFRNRRHRHIRHFVQAFADGVAVVAGGILAMILVFGIVAVAAWILR